MEPFQTLDAVAAPIDRANIDTDAIIPKQFLKSIRRSGSACFTTGATLQTERRPILTLS